MPDCMVYGSACFSLATSFGRWRRRRSWNKKETCTVHHNVILRREGGGLEGRSLQARCMCPSATPLLLFFFFSSFSDASESCLAETGIVCVYIPTHSTAQHPSSFERTFNDPSDNNNKETKKKGTFLACEKNKERKRRPGTHNKIWEEEEEEEPMGEPRDRFISMASCMKGKFHSIASLRRIPTSFPVDVSKRRGRVDTAEKGFSCEIESAWPTFYQLAKLRKGSILIVLRK